MVATWLDSGSFVNECLGLGGSLAVTVTFYS